MFRAYAKINLGLHVLRKREDGYHDIETVFHRIDLFDEIALEEAAGIEIITSNPAAPGDDSNICYKAARLLKEHLDVSAGVRIRLTKNIPVGAGLGGGSSDAAVILKELPRFFGRDPGELQMQALALHLGSDVPYFLRPRSATARGRGELLEYFPLDIPFTILLCAPPIHVSTAWAYRNVRPRPADSPGDLRRSLLAGMATPSLLAHTVRNDFETVAFGAHPAIGRVKDIMNQGGARFALMSGSGSSVYGLFSRPEDADATAHRLQAEGNKTFLTAPHFSPA